MKIIKTFTYKIIIGFAALIFFLNGCNEDLNNLNEINATIPPPDKSTIVFASDNGRGWHISLSFQPYDKICAISGGYLDGEPTWLPDKKEILYVRNTGLNQYFQIWKMNYDGSNRTQLTPTNMDCENPKYSLDGAKIVFVVRIEHRSDIYVMDSSGKNWKQITDSTTIPFYNVGILAGYPDWSPDGEKIVFSYTRRDSWKHGIAYINIKDNSFFDFKSIEIFPDPYQPCWSPKGNEIIFLGETSAAEGPKIFRMNTDGTNMVQLTDLWASYDPQWNQDGSMIAFSGLDSLNTFQCIWTMNRDGTGKKKIINIPGANATSPRW